MGTCVCGANYLYEQSSRGSIQFWMESWASPTSSSPCEASTSSFQFNCSRAGDATQAAVLVLYYCVLWESYSDFTKPSPLGVLDIFRTILLELILSLSM